MKSFKLLITSLVVSCFFFTTDVDAQADVWEDTFPHSVYVPCLGEVLTGTMYRHLVENDKFRIISWHGEYTGNTTGKTYRAIGSDRFPPGQFFTNRDASVRVLGDEGLVMRIKRVTANGTFTLECY